MIIEDIKLKNPVKNKSMSPYFRSRTLEIVTDKGSFFTPNRVITKAEYVARSGVPLAECLDLDLAINFRELTVEQTKNIVIHSDSVKELLELAEQFDTITRRAIFKIAIFQPPHEELLRMSSEDKIAFADFQADFLQKRLGAETITYPYLLLPIDEYKRFIDSRMMRDETISTIFTFDLGMNESNLRELLDHIVNKKQPAIICLIHRPWVDTAVQHNIISSYYDNEKTAFFACQVEREDFASKTSNIHALGSARGFDLVALRQARAGGSDKKLNLQKIKFFDPIKLEINPIEDVILNPGRNIADEFKFSPHNTRDFEYVSMITQYYEGAAHHRKKHRILYYLARLHEAMLSPRVFALTRTKILENELESYLKETSLKNSPMLSSI